METESTLSTYWYLCHSYSLKNGQYRYKFGTKQFNFVYVDANNFDIAKKKLFVNLPDGAKYGGVQMSIRSLEALRKHCIPISENDHEHIFQDLIFVMKYDDSDFLFADFGTANYCVVYTSDKVYIAYQHDVGGSPGLSWCSAERNPVE